ncbi:MAG: hypothetical protein KAS02_00070 [Candidatus Pacebacteria bacterium]|nr:hypothetical protein [Candidatus Paceibacterota bacterium]
MNTNKTKQILIAFVPVLHAGYIKLFKKFPTNIYLIDKNLLIESSIYKYFERDLRTMDEMVMQKAIKSLNIFENVNILDKNNLEEIKKEENFEIIFPDEAVSKEIQKKYFKDNKNISFENVFLRWDKPITLQETEVHPNRKITIEKFHQTMMGEALKQKKLSSDWWRQVGSVIVKDNKVILSGYNKHVPTDFSMDIYGDPRSNFDAGERYDLSTAIHSEASLISYAAKEGISLDGASIYVTTFPCPTCAKLIAGAGIKKVYYSEGYSVLDAENIFNAFNIEVILIQDN